MMNSMSNTAKIDYDSSSNASSFGPPSRVGMIVPTVSEEEQQGIRTNGKHLALLPRSVRWRIQLGLLGDPLANNTLKALILYLSPFLLHFFNISCPFQTNIQENKTKKI